MIGELGASTPTSVRPEPDVPAERIAAFLGADLEPGEDGRWRVVRVLPGESSVPTARSPLLAAGAGVEAGDVLVEINGRAVPDEGPGPLLTGTAGKPIELTVERDGDRRALVVVPVESELSLRYQAWVADRRQYVREHSDGKFGYVHVPDMISTGWAEFNRDLRNEVSREAMVVDTRENSGGHTSELVIERLARRVVGWENGRYVRSGTYPSDAPRGPLVSVIGGSTPVATVTSSTLHSRRWISGQSGRDGRGVASSASGGRCSLVAAPSSHSQVRVLVRQRGLGVENYGVDPTSRWPSRRRRGWTAPTRSSTPPSTCFAARGRSSRSDRRTCHGPADRSAPALPPRP
jgi:tricorn protease